MSGPDVSDLSVANGDGAKPTSEQVKQARELLRIEAEKMAAKKKACIEEIQKVLEKHKCQANIILTHVNLMTGRVEGMWDPVPVSDE